LNADHSWKHAKEREFATSFSVHHCQNYRGKTRDKIKTFSIQYFQ